MKRKDCTTLNRGNRRGSKLIEKATEGTVVRNRGGQRATRVCKKEKILRGEKGQDEMIKSISYAEQKGGKKKIVSSRKRSGILEQQ